MKRFSPLLVALITCYSWSVALAQERLPAQLAGTSLFFGNTSIIVSWSIVIESQAPDGAIAGKMNWDGRRCQFKDLAFTGMYRNGVMEITAPATSPTCGSWNIKMSRTSPTDFAFEGTATSEGNPSTSVTLKTR